ncbi:hypothetical protein [Pontibacter beigongshangensis]|uniref:hypothetical protein n=1 Tax=Pontibacter beigongshangensis TaxID=2574733 RepID=UPI001650B586|nr:hypothetical protein [Pontibacter beigongshangensis]
MKIVGKLLFVLTTATLVSCDPAKTLTIKNKMREDITIRVKVKPNSRYFFSESDSAEFSLIAKGMKSEVLIYYGFGFWTKSELTEIHNSIEEVQIISKSDTTNFTSKEELQFILPKRRRGLLNNFLEVKIK